MFKIFLIITIMALNLFSATIIAIPWQNASTDTKPIEAAKPWQNASTCVTINVCPPTYEETPSKDSSNGNCRKTAYKCNNNTKVVNIGNKWKCSSLFCDSNMKCGYGTCDSPTTPSTNKYMDVAYNPLLYITNNKCNGPLCDYVLNKEVSYCESKQCPKGDDIIQKDGKCYKLECPAGTYISGDKCIKSNY